MTCQAAQKYYCKVARLRKTTLAFMEVHSAKVIRGWVIKRQICARLVEVVMLVGISGADDFLLVLLCNRRDTGAAEKRERFS